MAADSVISGIEAVGKSACGCVAVLDDRRHLCATFGVIGCAEATLPGYLPVLDGARMIPESLNGVLLARSEVAGGCVADFADHREISIAADSSFLQLAHLFVTHRVPMIPVVESDDLVGVIPQERFLECLLVRGEVQ